MLPTHDVDCPHCGRFLYSALSLEDVVDSDSATSPRIENDAEGSFVRCPHCRARVAMKALVSAGKRVFRPAG